LPICGIGSGSPRHGRTSVSRSPSLTASNVPQCVRWTAMPSIVTTRCGSGPETKGFEPAGDEVHALAELRPQLFRERFPDQPAIQEVAYAEAHAP
jgi:hypothetical protein